jgi:hypothetical protein
MPQLFRTGEVAVGRVARFGQRRTTIVSWQAVTRRPRADSSRSITARAASVKLVGIQQQDPVALALSIADCFCGRALERSTNIRRYAVRRLPGRIIEFESSTTSVAERRLQAAGERAGIVEGVMTALSGGRGIAVRHGPERQQEPAYCQQQQEAAAPERRERRWC